MAPWFELDADGKSRLGDHGDPPEFREDFTPFSFFAAIGHLAARVIGVGIGRLPWDYPGITLSNRRNILAACPHESSDANASRQWL
jgi:hypothetical protein